jgi:hypothetical protein
MVPQGLKFQEIDQKTRILFINNTNRAILAKLWRFKALKFPKNDQKPILSHKS